MPSPNMVSRMQPRDAAMSETQAAIAVQARAGTVQTSPSNLPPLCVDMDGTIIRSDMLIEGVLALVASPRLYRALLGLRGGNRAAFKRSIASAADFDPALLPYNDAILVYLREQKAAGRQLFLVTAADSGVAQRIALHLDIFDEVIASDGMRNLKGRNKADALVERFGRDGFSYAGDSHADLAVWQVAQSGILVNATRRTAASARRLTTIEREFDHRGSSLSALFQAARPHQWVKNLLVFIPLLVSGTVFDAPSLVGAAIAFAAFCMTASGIYLLNDLADLTADRKHPRKRVRPFASGAATLRAGVVAAALFVAFGLTLAHTAGILLTILLYAALSVSYSAKLKEFPLVDVFMLGALYSIRLVGGGAASGHQVSLWLLAFSSFLFLGLALVKRVGELSTASKQGGQIARRGYEPADALVLQMFGCSSSVAAGVVLALFVQSEGTAERYASPELLWGLVPLVLFWQCRLWLSTARGYMHDDPIVYAARDRVSWLVLLAMGMLMVAARPLRIL